MRTEAPPCSPEAAEETFQREVRASLTRNYLAHLVHGLLGQTGFRLIQAPTFVPAYVHLLSGSDVAVGAARAIQSFGMFLSPILGATAIEHRRRVLRPGLWVGGLMRVQLLGLALAGFFLQGAPALVAVCAFLGLFGFFTGIQGVIFAFLVAKVIPVERRGRLLGLRNALAGVTAGAVGWLGGVLVEREALGDGYAATFLVAFLLTSAGLTTLLFMREPATPAVRAPSRVGERLRDLPRLLRSDPGFTRYFLARSLATMGRMALPFVWIYAEARLSLPARALGELTLAFLVSQSVGNLAWGWLADRRGFRVVFLASLALSALAMAWLMASDDLAGVRLVMFGLGAGQGGFLMSSQNLVLEFGSREDLPLRIAVANSASELVGAAAPLLGGILAATASYESVLWTAIGFQLASVLWVVLRVAEPRRRR
jgi:MFS family permease